jgi:hypothetical protein
MPIMIDPKLEARLRERCPQFRMQAFDDILFGFGA